MKIFVSLFAVTALTLAGCASTPQPANPLSVRLIGHVTLPHKMNAQGTVFGGISGLDYDAASDMFYLLSDDRSDNGPARFYTAKMDYDATAFRGVTIQTATLMRQQSDEPFPSKLTGGLVPDPEAIRFRAATQTLFWTSEGDKSLGLSPFVREMKPDGTFVRELPLPSRYTMQPKADTSKGPRDNLVFEGMTLTPDGKRVWVAMEGPLYEDGEPAKVGAAAAPSRFIEIDVESGKVLREIAYAADAIPNAPVPATAFADNGIPEILMRDSTRMLVLERAFSAGVGNSIRVYEIDTAGAHDVSGIVSFKDHPVKPVAKTLVVDFATLGLPRLDNTEAMSWGKRLPNGKRTLVFASDDNFNTRQINQFVVLEVSE